LGKAQALYPFFAPCLSRRIGTLHAPQRHLWAELLHFAMDTWRLPGFLGA